MSSHEILKTENVLVRIMELEKESSTEWHFHTEVRDFFVCLKGILQVETRDPAREIMLNPGQHAEVSPGEVHRVKNMGEDKTEYLLVQGVGSYDFVKTV